MSDKPVKGAVVDYSRNLGVYAEFEDTYNAAVVLSDSSAVGGFGNGAGPFVWLRIDGGEISKNSGASHMNVEQARGLRDALTTFIEASESEDNTSVE